jgi:hypothetical protein
MAVAVDAVSSAESVAGSGTTATHTLLTVGTSLSNGALIFGCTWDNAATSPTAHWDSTGTNQAMTLLGLVTSGSQGRVALFGLRNPTSGNKTFSTSWTTTAQCAMFGISFTGVLQTSDALAFPNFNSATGTSTAPSVIITSATNDITVGVLSAGGSTFSSVNNTSLYTAANFVPSAMNRGAGAATVTHSGVLAASNTWVIGGVDVAAAGFILNSQQLVMM